ncbi:MBL fold metallo-hydrolase [Geitlerinema sp. CS-897]|nr:MBL fold metallo-hydrolase [Geitlerinema sp. CS-897]
MLFRQLFDPETSTYTYLVADELSGDAAVIDPVVAQVDRDRTLIDELGSTLRYAIETHIHADHVTGGGKLRELTGCQTVVPENAQADCADRVLTDGEVLQVGRVSIRAIATWGHTDSHMAYLIDGDRVLTGDSLMIRGCGRTDFQSGDAGTLYDTITQRLFTLPDETLVYPGHDYRGHTVSTIGEEKRFNPRLVGRDRAAFIELMENLNLPQPQRIAEALPANVRCGCVSQNA